MRPIPPATSARCLQPADGCRRRSEGGNVSGRRSLRAYRRRYRQRHSRERNESFHGTLYEFNQNSPSTATPSSRIRPAGRSRSARFNQYGGTFSGPVGFPNRGWAKQVFFFFAYEGVKDALPAPSTTTVPTAAERNGDFSALLRVGASYQIYDPATGVRKEPRQASAFPNNIIPANRMSPIAKNYLQSIRWIPTSRDAPMARITSLSRPMASATTSITTLGRLDLNSPRPSQVLLSDARNNVRIGQGGERLGRSLI